MISSHFYMLYFLYLDIGLGVIWKPALAERLALGRYL